MSRMGISFVELTARTPLSRIRLPIALASKMHALVNNQQADQTSAGKRVTVSFLASYVGYGPAVETEAFDACPILLTQPAEDRWTPLHLSEMFLRRIKLVPVKTVLVENAGHYPIEQPGLDQMITAINEFCSDMTRLTRLEQCATMARHER